MSTSLQDVGTNQLNHRIHLWPIDKLVPYERNPRTHSVAQIKQIADSILQFGFVAPILVDDQAGIIAGHGRLEAAKSLDMDKVPVVKLTGLSEKLKRAYLIADNRLAENAGWDEYLLSEELKALENDGFQVEVLGFSDNELEALLEFEASTEDERADQLPALPSNEQTVSRLGDLWQLGDHRVLCGDCTEADEIRVLFGEGRRGDLAFTDPPYGVSYADKNEMLNKLDKGNRNQTPIKHDHLPLHVMSKLWRRCFSAWKNVLTDRASFYVTGPGGTLIFELAHVLAECGWEPRHSLVWNKNTHVLGRSDYNYKHETILYGWFDRHDFYGKGEFKTSVWDIDKPTHSELHPTMKPIALIENCLFNSSKKGDLVVDPFLGSGSTLIACEKNDRVCYGMEIDPHYVDVIVKRWQEFTGREVIRLSDGRAFSELAA